MRLGTTRRGHLAWLVATTGCQLLGGIDGISYVPDAGPQARTDGRGPDAAHDATHDGGSPFREAETTKDAPADRFVATVDAAECPAPADCADPKCIAAGYMCVPAPPVGWSVVSADFGADSPCPSGSSAAAPLHTVPSHIPSADCPCTCTVSSPPVCNVGDVDVDTSGAASVSPCKNKISLPVSGSGCTSAGGLFTLNTKWALAATPGPSGGSCAESSTPTYPPTDSVEVFACNVAAPSTAGCGDAGICMPMAGTRTTCAVGPAPSFDVCPAAYASPKQAGPSLMDDRACSGTCACGSPRATCSPTSLHVFTDALCTMGELAVTTSETCTGTGPAAAASFSSYEYAATASAVACTPSATPVATGTVTVANVETLCCAD